MAGKSEKSLFIKIGGKVAASLGKSTDETEKKLEKIGSTAKKVGKVAAVGLAAAATGAVALGAKVYDLSVDYSKATNQIQASLGLSADEAKEYGQVIQNIYGDNFGENFEEIAGNVALVKEQMGDIPLDEIEAATEAAYLLDDVYSIDIQESIRGANSMMKHLGVSAEEAYNLIAQGAEKGLNQNGDLADQLAEYSTYYGNLGFTAEEVMNIMAAGADSGVYQIDKLNDAVKEFSIKSIDGSKSTAEAFKTLGLNASEMSYAFAEGGEKSSEAFSLVLGRIAEMDDAVEQNAVGVSLFGSLWEDVGADGILALNDIQDEVDLTRDKLAEMNEVKFNDLGSMLEGMKRSMELFLLPLGEQLVPVIKDLSEEIQPLISDTLTDLMPVLMQLISDLLPPIIELVKTLLPIIMNIINSVLPVLIDLISAIVPIAIQIIDAILPVVNQLLEMLLPILQPIIDLLLTVLQDFIVPVLEPLMNMISSVLEPLQPLLEALSPILQIIGEVLGVVGAVLTPIIDAIATVVGWIADGLSWLVQAFIGGDTNAAEESAANVQTYATGGWAYEPSIFGEAGPEVAISFDPAYRRENIGYWREAGYLLGVIDDNENAAAQKNTEIINNFQSAPVSYDGEGTEGMTIIFAPQMTFNGNSDENDVREMLEEAYERFKSFMERYAKENRRVRFEV